MECPHAYQPELDEDQSFWKGVQTVCLQELSKVHWNPGKLHWHSPTCKFHTFQAALKRAVPEWQRNPTFIESMKRGLETEHTEPYVFSTNADINYKLTLEETKFLKALHLEAFITSVSWGVLHTQLVKEAIASLEPTTLQSTVKGESMAIIAKNWRKQFQQVFHLTSTREQPVTKEWQLEELFSPSKTTSEKQDMVRISDCQYPGAKRPLRLLSSLLCLNPTNQHHIAATFAQHILAALNGKAVDWPQEFYRELTGELITLHTKHNTSRVKAGKTAIGPHVTLLLRAAGTLNIREEFEAGYRTPKALTIAEQVPQPKRKKAQAVKGSGPQPKNKVLTPPHLGGTELPRSSSTPYAQVYAAIPQPAEDTRKVTPGRGVIPETTEFRPPPKVLPPMVEQICQAHRRLENLLVSFTTKALAKFVNQMNYEFFKIQRKATLDQHREQPGDNQSQVFLQAQEAQLKHLATQLANSEGLNDINIEAIFQLEEESATLQQRLDLAQEEILSLRAQKGEALAKLGNLQVKMEATLQQLGSKDQEIGHLNIRIIDMSGMLHRADNLAANQKATILRLESQIATHQHDLAEHNSETHKLDAETSTGWGKANRHQDGSASESVTDPAHPIMNREKHTLTIGVANRLLHELRRDLARTQQEKVDLLHRIGTHKEEVGQLTLPSSVTHPKTYIFYQILKHSRPLESVMQYHRAYGGLHLLLSGVPLLKTGCHLEFSQMQQIWSHADAAAKDTLAFMWSMGELKTPLGVMETISAAPTFYIKRYICRCFVLLGQQHNMISIPKEPFPTLRSYTHNQFHGVKEFQRNNAHCFDQALITLATEDTTVCYDAVQQYQALVSKIPEGVVHPTLSQLKDFVSKTLDEQQETLSRRRFSTINSGTLQLKAKDQMRTPHESMGTCFL